MNQWAKILGVRRHVMGECVSTTEIRPAVATHDATHDAAVSLGRLGGLKGGPARAAALSAERKKEIASKAAKARWKKAASCDD